MNRRTLNLTDLENLAKVDAPAAKLAAYREAQLRADNDPVSIPAKVFIAAMALVSVFLVVTQ